MDLNFIIFLPYAGATEVKNVFLYVYKKVIKPMNKPFFTWLHFMDTHHPYLPPNKYVKMNLAKEIIVGYVSGLITANTRENIEIFREYIDDIRTLYSGAIKYIDPIIGEIIEFLKEENVYDKTIIVITSDHGEGFFEHNFIGHGPYLYDELLHVPYLVKLPNGENIVYNKLASLIDIYKSATNNFILPLRRKIYAEVWGSDINNLYYSIRTSRYKLILDMKTKKIKLFDLIRDPYEQIDISDNDRDIALTLLDELKRHILFIKRRKQRLRELIDIINKLKKLEIK